MDEPCSALDAEGIERIEELIDGLREKYTILIVTHNMAQARRASHECIFMLMGRIVEHDATLECSSRRAKKKRKCTLPAATDNMRRGIAGVPLLACPAVQGAAVQHCWTSQQWHPM